MPSLLVDESQPRVRGAPVWLYLWIRYVIPGAILLVEMVAMDIVLGLSSTVPA